MYRANQPRVLALVDPGDRVLEVGNPGGLALATHRIGPGPARPDDPTALIRVERDLCDPHPWPFDDHAFDFCLCVGTLEAVRDPLRVCREMIRVARRGYVEVTSRILESCRGQEPGVPVGFSDHRYLVEVDVPTLVFTPKPGLLHGERSLSFPAQVASALPEQRRVSWLFWDEAFLFREAPCPGPAELRAYRDRQAQTLLPPPHPPLLRRLAQRYPRLAAPVRKALRKIA